MAGTAAANVVPILEEINFSNWQSEITTIMKKEQCEEELENPPPESAQAIIEQGVSDKPLEIIKDCQSDKDQTTALKTSSFTKLSLWRKLIKLKLRTSDKMEDHFLEFDKIIRDLKELKSNIDESDKVCYLLLSLPSKYDAVVTALETVSDLKMDFVKARLLDEEMKLKARDGNKENENNEGAAGGAKKGGSGYTKTMTLSPELAALVGQDSMARHEVVKKVWAIIKEKDLYDPKNKQFAICDDALMKVIGVKRFRTFGMMKYLKTHFIS